MTGQPAGRLFFHPTCAKIIRWARGACGMHSLCIDRPVTARADEGSVVASCDRHRSHGNHALTLGSARPTAFMTAPLRISAVAASISGEKCRSSSKVGTSARSNRRTASSGRGGSQRRVEVAALRRREQLDAEHMAEDWPPSAAAAARHAPPSRRDPPDWRRSESNRRWPDRRAACSRRPAPPPSPAGS